LIILTIDVLKVDAFVIDVLEVDVLGARLDKNYKLQYVKTLAS
jgi:hypothetical protein